MSEHFPPTSNTSTGGDSRAARHSSSGYDLGTDRRHQSFGTSDRTASRDYDRSNSYRERERRGDHHRVDDRDYDKGGRHRDNKHHDRRDDNSRDRYDKYDKYERHGNSNSKYESGNNEHRGRERHREYVEKDQRDYRNRSRSRDYSQHHHSRSGNDSGRYFRDGTTSNKRRDKSPIVLFDKYSVENLSPYRGVALPLEERQRILKNWDIAPPGFERISADKAKLTGLFPPPGNIAKITNFVPPTLDPTKAAMLAMLTNSTAEMGTASYLSSGAALFAPALAKQARRVYVGGIPANCNEEEIADYFNQKMNAILPSPMGHYVLGVEISGDRDYAFVDLRSSEEAALACHLNESLFKGFTVAVRRTREFFNNTAAATLELPAEPSEHNQLVIAGLPLFFLEAHLKYLMTPFGHLKFLRLLVDERNPKASFGVAVLELDDPQAVEPIQNEVDGFEMGSYRLKVKKLPDCIDDQEIASVLSLFSLTPGKATSDPSNVMQLLNVVTIDDLADDAEYTSILDDIRQECEEYGEIQSLLIPRPRSDQRVSGIGKVFVEFKKVESCMKAVGELSGRLFADRTVLTSYYPPEKYYKRIL